MEIEYLKLVSVFFIGVFASFYGSMVGSGGLLNIPFLIFFGLPPQVAIASNKCLGVGLNIGAFAKFVKTRNVRWEYVLSFTLIGIASALIGANLLIAIDKDLLLKVVGIFILLMIPLILVNKNFGIKTDVPTTLRKVFGFIIYFFCMVWGSFFGGGGGTLVFMTQIHFFKFTLLEASATNKIPWFVMSVITVIIFALAGYVNWLYSTVLFGGGIIGGQLGASFALKKGNTWLKHIFVIVIFASGVKLLFF